MMYMPDLLKATTDLMSAPDECLTQRTYNVGAISFTPRDLAASIRRRVPEFTIDYKPDFRQAIADTWPQRLDDSAARRDWGWRPMYDVDAMTDDMFDALGPVEPMKAEELSVSVRQAAERRKEMLDFLEQSNEKVTVL